MNSFSSSEGKVILLGEHAVVYGHPAIVTGIAEGARARAALSLNTTLSVAGEELVPGLAELELALDALLRELGSPKVRVEAEILVPAGLGLGASAALGVAIARAVLRLAHGKKLSPIEQFRVVTAAAQAWETVFHGTPSGIDVTAAALGGCFQFTRGKGPSPITVTKPLTLVIAAVGPQVSTKVMVNGLAQLRARHPQRVNQALDRIGTLVQSASTAIETGDLTTLGHLMCLNQIELSGLSLSTGLLDTACRIALEAGALGAKLTGKGGGGCVVALCQNDATPVMAAFRAKEIDCFTTTIPAEPNSLAVNATP